MLTKFNQEHDDIKSGVWVKKTGSIQFMALTLYASIKTVASSVSR
ncbi:hypothetical protein OK016_17690 [Vibrio chagasii]|nr:hypothetical protein [Vibrio chagasii]